MDEELVKERLRAISVENIEFSKHARDNFNVRGFSPEEIIRLLKSTERIRTIEYQPDERAGKKYKLWVSKSRDHNMVVVINMMNGKIRVVTFHLESSKRMERLEKWLEKK